MNALERLLSCSGAWEGYNRVQPTAVDSVNESSSRLTVTPVLRDTFVRIDQTWSWKDKPQSGSFLIGYAREIDTASIHWIDTWHNGTRVMPLVGKFDAKGDLVAQGNFPVESGPDWGWRIGIRLNDGGLKIDMFCIDPAGPSEAGWVWSEYCRA